jgi:Holliday junction resolvasome RuvABC endonuclease subunit
MTTVLGLDASTTTIGISVLKYNSESNETTLIYHEFYKPNKADGIITMIIQARDYILNICNKFNIDIFVIEEYIKFMKGKSSSATIIPLAVLNTFLQAAVVDTLKKTPNVLNVLKIRHAIKLTKVFPDKSQVPEIMAHHLKLSEFPWYKKINRKKEEVIIEESYDVADSMAVAFTWIKLNLMPKPEKIKKVRVSKKKQESINGS